MGNFSEQPPANLGTGTVESDPVAELFSASYVFGAPVYAIEQTPGPSDVAPSPSTTIEPPIDVTSEPAPPPDTEKHAGSGSQWFLWSSSKTSLTLSLPNGAPIRAVWLPQIPFAVAIAPSQAPGSIMYEPTPNGSEVVPIPGKGGSVSLSTLTSSTHPAVWVYATSDALAPSRTGGLQPYSFTLVSSNAATPCPGPSGGPAAYLYGAINNALTAQSATLNVYDSAAAASGVIVASIAALGPTQILTFPNPGIPLANGAVAIASATPTAPGIQVLTR